MDKVVILLEMFILLLGFSLVISYFVTELVRKISSLAYRIAILFLGIIGFSGYYIIALISTGSLDVKNNIFWLIFMIASGISVGVLLVANLLLEEQMKEDKYR